MSISSSAVLILILMEHAQRDLDWNEWFEFYSVLILILMEHAQRDFWQGEDNAFEKSGLNPYFNGTCSKRDKDETDRSLARRCLNPYFNGTCSKR